MKAAIIKDYQAAIEVASIDKPELKDDSVLVAVHAASINPIDDILRSGRGDSQIAGTPDGRSRFIGPWDRSMASARAARARSVSKCYSRKRKCLGADNSPPVLLVPVDLPLT